MRQINNQKYNIKDNSFGFTFVELLVSFAVMTIAMLGIFSLIIQNIRIQRVNKNYLVASMLSPEGLELVRSIRDETWLDPAPTPPGTWDNLVGMYSNNDFIVDQVSWAQEVVNAPDTTTITDDPACLLNMVGGFYQHGAGGTPTQFYRIIEIIPGPDVAPKDGIADSTPDEDGDGVTDYINVVSRVEWLSKGVVRHYITETLLYDWR